MFIQKSIAQDTIASVEKSNFGIQTGLIGLWGFNEYKLSNPISLRSEIGVQLGFSTGYDKTYTTIFPSLSIEPRWYYNLNKRLRKGKNIKKIVVIIFPSILFTTQIKLYIQATKT